MAVKQGLLVAGIVDLRIVASVSAGAQADVIGATSIWRWRSSSSLRWRIASHSPASPA
jgi:hypothetical protein